MLSLLLTFLTRNSLRVTSLTLALTAGYIYLFNCPRMLQALPILGITLILAIEWIISRPIQKLNRELEGLIDRDELTAKALKDLKNGLNPELKTIINPLYLTVARIENEKLQNQEKAKDLQRWKAQRSEDPVLEHQTLTNFAGLTDTVDLTRFGERLAGVSKSFETLAIEVLEAVQSNGSQEIKSAVFMRSLAQGKYTVAAALNIKPEQKLVLQKLFANQNNPLRSISGVAVDIGPLSMKRYHLDDFSEILHFNHAIVFPIENEGRKLGQIICFATKEGAFRPEKLKQIEKFCNQLAPSFYRLDLLDIERERQNTDLLTGLRSRQYLNTLLNSSAVSGKTAKAETRQVLIVTGLDLHLPQLAGVTEDTVEKWLPQLANLVIETLSELPETINQGEIHTCRFQNNLIAILIEQAHPDYVESLARALLARVAASQWQGVQTAMSASMGLCICNNDPVQNGGEQDAKEPGYPSGAALASKALRALYYTQEKLGPGRCAWISQVPPDYQPQKFAVIDGELGVLDGFSLLQSIAASAKTGILSVTSETGEAFVSAWNQGKLTHAKLGKALGLDAITEFIIFCTSGHFHFQQMQKLPSIYEPEAKTPNLDQSLMSASLAADHYEMARKSIPSVATMLLRTEPLDKSIDQVWQDLHSDEEISSRELTATKELYDKLSSTATPMSTLFKQIEENNPDIHYPLSLKWRAAYLLMKHQLLKTN